jgi:Cyclopropane fatty acid synthase and related methyltransferases
MMGPNSMWLLEDVCEHLDLKPGTRVLDLGCGKGLTSIFLAKEFGVTVYATDLWISATENYELFKTFGLEYQIIPIHAEAHNLPYADEYFDAAISIDSYHYFGANDTYLPEYFARLVKHGGQFGIAAPGLTKELKGKIPDSMKSVWKEEQMDDLLTFRSVGWWKSTWEKSGLVDITSCGEIEDARTIWYDWAKIARGRLGFNDDELLDADKDNYLTFVYFTAVKKD